jgi:peptidoglycan-N-acetylglucosamine deacetylase
MMPVKSPSEGLSAFWEEFDAQYEAGGFWIGIWHPFLTGRLARWAQVEKWLEETLRTKKVWFAPLEDIIAYVKNLSDAREYLPRVEQLPYYTKSQVLG